jgi:hypothetical protein
MAVVAFGIASGSLSSSSTQRSRRQPLVETDSRRLEPGVHRAGPAELAVRNRVAQVESARLQDRARQRAQARESAASVPATAWVSLGPTGALSEFNNVDIAGVDSGRVNAIVVDPREPNIVYLASSGGGVWKTFNFLSASGPTWIPLSDTLPNLAVGALALDEASADTLYVGNGDFVDGSGNTVVKSIDGGATWGSPVVLTGNYPAPNNFAAKVRAVRAIGVRGAQVLAGTDVGLFVSSNGGASFALVDLPNVHGKILTESIWSVVHTGNGHWVASGVTGCDEATGPPPLAGGQEPGATDATGNVVCAQGNNGEIWYSADGVTWTQSTLPIATGIGRLTLAAGATSVPSSTVVYAYVGSTNGSSTVGLWRSMDGGLTWADATGTLVNPTNVVNGRSECEGLNLAHDQTWYDQAIVVDPTNPDHVVAGGNACGMRTLNGTVASPTWELVAHWLPNWDGGLTANGRLPYVHADWQTATSVIVGGGVRTIAGTDGGVFSSTDVFDPAIKGEQVVWTHHNNGLVTHLMYALGSGDPVTGNPFVLFAGLQDNGTRYRADPTRPSVFNQPVGADGIGATVHVAASGTTYWASLQFSHAFCQPSPAVDCADGHSWQFRDPPLNPDPAEARESRSLPPSGLPGAGPGGEDQEPFLIHYANVETDTLGQSVLTHSTGQIFVSFDDNGALAWKPISQDLTASGVGFANVGASRTTPGLYGAVGTVSIAPFYVTTAGNTMTTWTVAKPVFPIGTADRLTGPSSIDFPPILPAGTVPGQVFIGSFTNTMNDAARTPPPDDKGHLWRTTDFGQTWTSIVGASPAHRLPNVAVYVAKYDPVTPTTIYAGTDLGVYLTTDDGASWDRMGEGFPMVPVRDIYVAKNQDFIRVATFGRGLWEIYPSAAANQGTPGNGDYDRNVRFDWIDLAAMSSRLGATPANTTPPFYSWILDIVAGGSAPPLQQIDDADLAALLTNFGGHP